jgi:hypothetical protein
VRGQTQVVLYAPEDSAHVYGHEEHDGQSGYDPLTPDLAKYPSAR